MLNYGDWNVVLTSHHQNCDLAGLGSQGLLCQGYIVFSLKVIKLMGNLKIIILGTKEFPKVKFSHLAISKTVRGNIT